MGESRDIRTIEDPQLSLLCDQLRQNAASHAADAWPEASLQSCSQRGVFRWFVPQHLGGYGWTSSETVQGYLSLSAACLTTTFVVTQLMGAVKRIVASDNVSLRDRILPALLTGDAYATLGISHLTTSRQHLGQSVLTAEAIDGGFRLNGFSPWVTGAQHAKYLVVGASLDDGRQLLCVVPTATEGVTTPEPARLIALSASHTGAARFDRVVVPHDDVLAGPMMDVMNASVGARTGGLQTSTLALGLSSAAIQYVQDESHQRPTLQESAAQLTDELARWKISLLQLATEGTGKLTAAELRAHSNSLVLRATQTALMTAKGAGFVQGHPVGRWCQEALFFLVWSCPQPVVAANLCEFSGIPS